VSCLPHTATPAINHGQRPHSAALSEYRQRFLNGAQGSVVSPNFPFFFGSGAIVVAIAVLVLGRGYLASVDAPETAEEEAEVIIGELEAAAGA
jgi:hypothetical protein